MPSCFAANTTRIVAAAPRPWLHTVGTAGAHLAYGVYTSCTVQASQRDTVLMSSGTNEGGSLSNTLGSFPSYWPCTELHGSQEMTYTAHLHVYKKIVKHIYISNNIQKIVVHTIVLPQINILINRVIIS